MTTDAPPTRAAIPDDRLVWLDLETTGLDPYQDEILECAVIVTEADLTEVARFARVTDGARHADYAKLDPVVQKMHADNGLWLESLRSKVDDAALDTDLAEFVLLHAGGRAVLAGNSINFDAEFIRRALPRTHAHLHHRQGNVSAVNEFARRRWPEVYASRPQGAAHRAMADALSSIEQARHYFRGLAPAAHAQAAENIALMRVAEVARIDGPMTVDAVCAQVAILRARLDALDLTPAERNGLAHVVGCSRIGTVGDGQHEAIRWIARLLDATCDRVFAAATPTHGPGHGVMF